MLEVVSGIRDHPTASLADQPRPAGEITAFVASGCGISWGWCHRDALAGNVDEVDLTADVARSLDVVIRVGWGGIGRIGSEHGTEARACLSVKQSWRASRCILPEVLRPAHAPSRFTLLDPRIMIPLGPRRPDGAKCLRHHPRPEAPRARTTPLAIIELSSRRWIWSPWGVAARLRGCADTDRGWIATHRRARDRHV